MSDMVLLSFFVSWEHLCSSYFHFIVLATGPSRLRAKASLSRQVISICTDFIQWSRSVTIFTPVHPRSRWTHLKTFCYDYEANVCIVYAWHHINALFHRVPVDCSGHTLAPEHEENGIYDGQTKRRTGLRFYVYMYSHMRNNRHGTGNMLKCKGNFVKNI